MTVTTTTTYNELAGTAGVFAYAFTFRCDDSSWVKVYLDDVLQASGYSVALNADQETSPGGTVTFVTAPTGMDVLIKRSTAKTQATAYAAYDAFPAKTHERALDKLAVVTQDIARDAADATAAEAALRAAADADEVVARTAADAAERLARMAADDEIIAGGVPVATTGASFVTPSGSATARTLSTWTSFLESRISVKEARFSAVGDGTTDDTAAIQAALDYAVANGVKYVYFPRGSYKLTAPLILADLSGGAYRYQGVCLIGEGFDTAGTHNVKITQTDPDQACLLVQLWFGGFCEGIAFYGQATHIEGFGLGEVGDPTTDWFGTCSSRQYSPHAGIVIDPFAVDIAGADQYPALGAQYVGSGAGSSRFAIRGCYFRDLVVGAMVSNKVSVRNGEVCDFDSNTFWACHTALAIGQDQALSVFVRNMEAWSNIQTAISGNVWGSKTGCFPRVEGLNVAGGCYRLFSYDTNWASHLGIECKGLHAEKLFTIGEASYMTLVEPRICFVNYLDEGVRANGDQGNVFNTRFVGGYLGQYMYGSTPNYMYLNGCRTAQFIGTTFEGLVIDSVVPSDGDGDADNASFVGVRYIYGSGPGGPTSRPGLYHGELSANLQGARFSGGQFWEGRPTAFGTFLTRSGIRGRGGRLKFIDLGSKTISNPAYATATFNPTTSTDPSPVTLTHVALLSVGMYVKLRGYTPPAGVVTDIDYGTGDVTMQILDATVNASDTYEVVFLNTDMSPVAGMPTTSANVYHPLPFGASIDPGQLSQLALTVAPMMISFTHTDASRYVRVNDPIYCYGYGVFSGLAGRVHSIDGDTVYVTDQNRDLPDGATANMYVVHERRFLAPAVATLTSGSADIVVVDALLSLPLGSRVFGTGIPDGAYVTDISAAPTVTLSAPATATRTSWLSDALIDFDLEGISIPTGGVYPLGTFIKNSAPAESGATPNKRIILGWSKITEAATNVLGTDWAPVYAGTGDGMTQGAAVADGSTVNQLLASLRAAGLIAT